MILKSHYLNTVIIKKICAPLIVFQTIFCKMMLSIQLNSKFFTGTIKVKNKNTKAVLPSEFSSFKLAAL